ncbi:MAG: hypothetical protein R2795_05375 [Saprospiraceae bacterium]
MSERMKTILFYITPSGFNAVRYDGTLQYCHPFGIFFIPDLGGFVIP